MSYRKNSLTPQLSQHHAADWIHYRAALLGLFLQGAILPHSTVVSSLSGCHCCLWLNHSNTRRLKFGEIKAKFVFDACKRGCGKSVSTDVIRVGRRKVCNAWLRCWFWTSGFEASKINVKPPLEKFISDQGNTKLGRGSKHSSCSPFPKCWGPFFPENLPETVDDTTVCRLASTGSHLQSCLDDISRGHQRCSWDTFQKKTTFI